MSRQRFIYPEMFTSADFMALRYAARLTWVGMFTLADDYGRGRASGAALKASIFPGDDVRPTQVEEYRDEVVRQGMVRLYTVNEQLYYEIPTWSKYQNPRYKGTPKVPVPHSSTGFPQPGESNKSDVSQQLPRSPGDPVPILRGSPGGSDAVVGCGVVWCGGEGSEVRSKARSEDPGARPPQPARPNPAEVGAQPRTIRPARRAPAPGAPTPPHSPRGTPNRNPEPPPPSPTQGPDLGSTSTPLQPEPSQADLEKRLLKAGVDPQKIRRDCGGHILPEVVQFFEMQRERLGRAPKPRGQTNDRPESEVPVSTEAPTST